MRKWRIITGEWRKISISFLSFWFPDHKQYISRIFADQKCHPLVFIKLAESCDMVLVGCSQIFLFKQNIKRKLSLKMREYLCCFPFFLPVILLFPLSQDLCVCTCNSVPMLLAPALYSADCFSCFTSQLKCLFLEKVPIDSICSRPPLHVKALLERKNPCLFCSLIYP